MQMVFSNCTGKIREICSNSARSSGSILIFQLLPRSGLIVRLLGFILCFFFLAQKSFQIGLSQENTNLVITNQSNKFNLLNYTRSFTNARLETFGICGRQRLQRYQKFHWNRPKFQFLPFGCSLIIDFNWHRHSCFVKNNAISCSCKAFKLVSLGHPISGCPSCSSVKTSSYKMV